MSRTNRINVPESRAAMDNMKFEIAQQLGVNLKQGYNGNLTSRENGYVGGYMVNTMMTERITECECLTRYGHPTTKVYHYSVGV